MASTFLDALKWLCGTIGLGLVSIKAHYNLSLTVPGQLYLRLAAKVFMVFWRDSIIKFG